MSFTCIIHITVDLHGNPTDIKKFYVSKEALRYYHRSYLISHGDNLNISQWDIHDYFVTNALDYGSVILDDKRIDESIVTFTKI